MLKSLIQNLSEGKYGKTVHEFDAAPLSESNRSALSFIVNEKGGMKKLVLVLQEDVGHEIDREYAEVDIDCLDDVARLIDDVREYVRSNR